MAHIYSDRLIALREQASETQDAVAEAADISRVAYTRYENGSREPKATVAIKLARHFGVTVEELFSESGTCSSNNEQPEASLTEVEQNLIADFRSLNRQGKEYILQTMSMASTIYKNDAVSHMENRA